MPIVSGGSGGGGPVFDGEIDDIAVRVPSGWYLKMTVVNATLGLTTYY